MLPRPVPPLLTLWYDLSMPWRGHHGILELCLCSCCSHLEPWHLASLLGRVHATAQCLRRPQENDWLLSSSSSR